jgi:uncharacterized membrane protein YdfJ with MMPL/SSD domain
VVTIVLWVFVAASLALGISAFGAQTNNNVTLPGTGSQEATNVLQARFPPQQNGTNPIVFYAQEGKLTDAQHSQAMKDSIKALREAPEVYSVINPTSSKGQSAGLLSSDKATGYAPVLLSVNSGAIDVELAQEILDAARGPAGKAGIEVEAGGSIGSRLSEPATESSEVVGIASAMVILTLVLGSLIAMGLPILTAIFGLSVALSAIGLLGHLFGIPSIAPTVATMIGLGVGIDYALFLVTRHQDQLRDGMATKESVAQAVATSGGAIVFAGGTVVIALVSLVVAGIPLVTSMGYASAVAVFTAVVAAVTLLPALLSLVGGGIWRLAIPGFLQRREAGAGGGFWAGWARAVTGHPWLVVGACLFVLAPLTVPLFTLVLGQEDIAVMPTSTTERRAYDLVTDGLGVGYNGPLLFAVVLDPVAKPSSEYEKKYKRATSLQKQLEKEQKQLTAQQASLEQQQAVLEQQQAILEKQQSQLLKQSAALTAEADALEAQGIVLAQQGKQLEAQQAALRAQAEDLKAQRQELRKQAKALAKQARQVAASAARTAAALRVVREREALLEQRIAAATDPVKIAELEARLDRVLEREVSLEARAAELKAQAKQLKKDAQALARQADALRQQKQVLKAKRGDLIAQADALAVDAVALVEQGVQLEIEKEQLLAEKQSLEQQKKILQDQANSLQQQANELKQQQKQAQQQKKTAEKLQRELTKQLTAAGGDDRATDPRVVKLQDAVLATPDIVSLLPPQVSDKGDALVFNAVPSTAPAADETAALVKVLRAKIVPEATSEGGISAFIGGYTASYVDLAAKISSRLPMVILTVLGLSFILLLLAFRSVLVPLQAAITNLLSVGASLGVLTAVFQWGWGLSLVGLDAPDGTVPIASYVPLMMFAILFGLSMDYEVFLVSHIVAYHQSGESPTQSVRSGLSGSARVVSAAALIMICVFGSFILNGDPTVKQFGVGLSVAVFLAAALVLLLAPALLIIFGRGTWWLPRWLDKILPDIGLDEGPMAPAEDVSVPAA